MPSAYPRMSRSADNHHRATPQHRLAFVLDRAVATLACLCMVMLIIAFSRVNLTTDSVDYYAILMRMVSPVERPIVGNLHFVEQRSPGYPLASLVAYTVLDLAVEPFVATERVDGAGATGSTAPPRDDPQGLQGEGEGYPRSGGKRGSEQARFPPDPLLLRQVPFKDFYLRMEGSWLGWKAILALATTSYLGLLIGLLAIARALKLQYPELPGYSLLAVFGLHLPGLCSEHA